MEGYSRRAGPCWTGEAQRGKLRPGCGYSPGFCPRNVFRVLLAIREGVESDKVVVGL